MEQSNTPFTRDLVFIGGGHTHALVLHEWAMKPLPGARLTVINPEPVAAYSGMLPGYIAGHYERDELDIDLERLTRRAGARLVIAKATRIDRERKRIQIDRGPDIAYDIASIDVGITSTLTKLKGFAEHGLAAKPLSQFARAWAAYRERPGKAKIIVIGAGVAGAEVVMAMVHALKTDGRDHAITLLDRGQAFGALGTRAAGLLRERVEAHGVEVIENVEPVEVLADRVHLSDGREVATNLVVGAAGTNPYPWLVPSGLTDDGGFIPVDRYLRSRDNTIFAVGDCATLPDPRPKAGVYAVRQAPFLAANLKEALSGSGPKKPYVPQKDYLKLISLGRKTALGEKWGLSFKADRLWQLKDDIDEKFMSKLNQPIPAMAKPPHPRARGDAPEMLCGGCGSKVGQEALLNALGASAVHDDAAVIDMGNKTQVISTDHLRAFVADPVMMAKIAVSHAMGDIWAMGAEPQAALASIILPRQSPVLAERELSELMHAAQESVEAVGAELVGGHTSQGAELTIGFTVTGLCNKAPIGLSGAQPGDDIVLTKPIGSGTLMAAAMRGLSRGWDVYHAWQIMAAPQGKAAAFLSGAHAMTDVTGFGLAGHARGIAAASRATVELWPEAVPLMDGALAISASGIRSSLFAENSGGEEHNALHALMYDPQTGGGLLAAVSDGGIVDALKEAGFQAAVVGRVVEGPGEVRIV
ncbi:MAG: selenide, water dikinase SelD [Pseudomonadota bacterium]